MKGGCQRKLRRVLTATTDAYFASIWLQTLVFAVSIASCVFYIVTTSAQFNYGFEINYGAYVFFSVFFFVVFLIDYILSIIAADPKIDYLVSPIGLADLAALLPVLSLFAATNNFAGSYESWLGFLRFFRLLKVLHLFRYSQLHDDDTIDTGFRPSEIAFLCARLVISIAVFVFISTGVVLYMSYLEPLSFTQELSWVGALYFMVVTISSVGYGDITPVTIPARVVVVIIIVIGFSFIIPMAGM
jgi:voltage-gated potassium channel